MCSRNLNSNSSFFFWHNREEKSEMGPLVTKEHLEKVKGYVDLGVKEGAKLVVDGRNLKLQGYEKIFCIYFFS